MAAVVEARVVPARTLQQRQEALKNANRIRTYRKDLKADLKAGRRRAVDVLRSPHADVLTMKVFDLLLAAPKLGRVKVNKMLSRQGISPSKTVGGLSPRQRDALLAALGARR
jgi:hypothetical protein